MTEITLTQVNVDNKLWQQYFQLMITAH